MSCPSVYKFRPTPKNAHTDEWDLKQNELSIEVVIKFSRSTGVCDRCHSKVVKKNFCPGFFLEGTANELCRDCVYSIDNQIYDALHRDCYCKDCREVYD